MTDDRGVTINQEIHVNRVLNYRNSLKVLILAKSSGPGIAGFVGRRWKPFGWPSGRMMGNNHNSQVVSINGHSYRLKDHGFSQPSYPKEGGKTVSATPA
jgi:hypothetical protein